MHCRRFTPLPTTRRELLLRSAHGFGAAALAGLLTEDAFGGALTQSTPDRNPFAPKASHFAPRAKHVIFLYMDGGPSQIDTFDPKPRLQAEHGQPFKMTIQPTQFDNIGSTFGCP